MITPEQKAAWLAALRSGEYPQTEGLLRDETGYCCLGVACVVFGPGLEWEEAWENGHWVTADETRSVVDWFAGLDPEIKAEHDQRYVLGTALEMNDDGSTFAEIADYLEKNLMTVAAS